jgi:acyl transferase domain-containing protein
MLAVQGTSHEVISTLLSRVSCLPPLEIASVNGPSGVTVSGPISGLTALETLLTEEQPGLRVSKLNVSHAFHSSAMDAALPALHEACGAIAFSPPNKARFISLVTGAALTSAPEAEHWVHNVRNTVQLYDGLCEMARDGRPRVLIEIGPDAILTPLARRALLPSSDETGEGKGNASVKGLIASMSKRRREDENLGLAEAMAAAYDAGVTLDFQVCL